MAQARYPLPHKKLSIEAVTSLYAAGDEGPLECACNGDPDACHCSTIMMLCIEWMQANGFNPGPISNGR